MDKEKTIEQINSILEKVDDENVLKDMLNLVGTIFRHYTSGKWGR